MTLMPHVDAVLIFDASDAETTGEYDVYSISPSEQGRLWAQWDVIRAGLTPRGRVPVSDVEFDEGTGFGIRTFGIERFAAST